MIIEKLIIENYKNLFLNEIKFNESINIVIGNNGQGKTNLLESIYFLSTTKTIKNTNNIIKDNELYCKIKCLVKEKRNNLLEVLINNEGKHLKINDNKIEKSSEFIGKINAVLFIPSEIDLFDGLPQKRRRLVDIELGKLSKDYINHLNSYNNLLKYRNKVLKEEVVNNELIEIINEKMFVFQKDIISNRNNFISNINRNINKYFNLFLNSNKFIKIEYKSFININEYDYKVRNIYKDNHRRDVFTKTTNVGIHKDDYIFYIDDKLVVNYASQGQKRLIILSFKLALIDYIYEITKDYPILLLDDVMSELDLNNQKILLEVIPKEVQTIITTTHLNKILNIKNYNVITMKDGTIMEENI